ncbi:MAG: hypothetical protein ACRDWD_05875 [Acidimicrobiia bacterium]
MATRRTTFEKLQRERDKKAKAAAKRERRQERAAADRGEGEGEGLEGPGATITDSDEVRPDLSPAEILEQIEVAHEQYKAGRMTSEDFEERKTELLTILAELPIE